MKTPLPGTPAPTSPVDEVVAPPPEETATPLHVRPEPVRPKPAAPAAAKAAKEGPAPKIFTLRVAALIGAALVVISLFLGVNIGRGVVPSSTPTDLSGLKAEIAGLKLAMESGQSSAAKVAELEKALAEAQAAQKAAEAMAEKALSRLEKIKPLDEESMKALRPLLEGFPAEKALYEGPTTQ